MVLIFYCILFCFAIYIVSEWRPTEVYFFLSLLLLFLRMQILEDILNPKIKSMAGTKY